MNDLESLATSIERCVSGPVWHGDSLGELLRAISAADAARHPIEGAHSIWELVHHISAWASIAETRLARSRTGEPTDAEDWPPVSRPTPTVWKHALEQLTASHEQLANAVRRLEHDDLDRRVPGRQYTVRTMLHGVVEHGAYHGGQIALLTRAAHDRRTQ